MEMFLIFRGPDPWPRQSAIFSLRCKQTHTRLQLERGIPAVSRRHAHFQRFQGSSTLDDQSGIQKGEEADPKSLSN